MSERALLERFDLVADNSENIPLLRRYIVDLAVRGKLLEKTALDISASEMLKRIEAKADSLLKQGKLKKQKPLPPISAEEVPATYVAHCTFERLGNVANLQKGLTGIQGAISGEFPLVVTAAARSTCDHYDFDGAAAIVPMVSSTGHGNASLNRLHYQEGKFALGTILCAIFPIDEELVSARFLFEYLTAFKNELLVSKMNGTANVTLTVGKIAEVPVPIIAPAVQRRVDELMTLCDQLEAAKNECEARRDWLVAASLHRISTAPATSSDSGIDIETAIALPEAARFHLAHLPDLTTRTEHVKQLRQTILGLVFQGRLTRRSDDEGLGIDLVNEIYTQWEAKESREARTEKLKLSARFKCDPPFSAPATWGWIQLQFLCDQIGDMDHKMPRAVSVGVPFLSAKDLKDSGELDFSDCKYISEEDFVRLSRKILPRRGDIIYSRIGARLGKARLVEVDTRFLISYSCCLIRPKHQFVEKRFLQIFLDSHLALNQAHSGVQSIGVPDLGLGEIKTYRIPMPALAEQHRIVAKVEELMALCSQLTAQLTSTQNETYCLLEAVLHEALGSSSNLSMQ